MMINGKSHWFGDHPNKVRSKYSSFINFFNQINPQELGIEIINCSKETALTCFPRKDLSDAL